MGLKTGPKTSVFKLKKTWKYQLIWRLTEERLGAWESLELEGRGQEGRRSGAALLREVHGVGPLGAALPHHEAHPQCHVGRRQVHEPEPRHQTEPLHHNLGTRQFRETF